MRRTLLILVGALAFAPTARSAIVTLYVDGSYTDVGAVEAQPFASSSVVNLDFDGSGNVTLVSASLFSSSSTSFGGLGFVDRSDSLTLSGGAGVLSGNEILWTSPSLVESHSRTLFCSGPICASLGLEQGVNPPQIGVPEGRYGQAPDLGRWLMSEDLSEVLGSTRAVFTVGGFTPPPEPGEPAEWLVFGAADLGFVPEPTVSALVLLALGALCGARRR